MDREQFKKIYRFIKELTIEQFERICLIFKEDYVDDICDNYFTILSGIGGM